MTPVEQSFHNHALLVHHEHNDLVVQLDQLDTALQNMVCYPHLFTDLSSANLAISGSKWLAEWLPGHYQNEETTVLADVAKISPELAAFAHEMKRQHKQMRLRLENFRELLSHLSESPDVETAVAAIKKAGTDLTRCMRLHMAAEENKFASLQN